MVDITLDLCRLNVSFVLEMCSENASNPTSGTQRCTFNVEPCFIRAICRRRRLANIVSTKYQFSLLSGGLGFKLPLAFPMWWTSGFSMWPFFHVL